MNKPHRQSPVSPLRQHLIDDMTMRRFSRETQRNYMRDVGRFAIFLGRPPGTATADDLCRFQVEQQDASVPVPTMNSLVSALRFFFTHTLDRPDLARKLVRLSHPRKLPVVLSRDKVARLLNATTCLKHQAALCAAKASIAFGTTACSPAARARRISPEPASCWPWRHRLRPSQRNQTIRCRLVPAVAGACASSRLLRVSGSRARLRAAPL